MSKLIGKIKSFLLSSVKTLPIVVGAAAPFIKVAPTGRSLMKDIQEGRIDNFLYDAREVFTGVDLNGKFHMEWVLGTYVPVIIGGLVSKVVDEVI